MNNFEPRNHNEGYGSGNEGLKSEILKIISEYGFASVHTSSEMDAEIIKVKGLEKAYDDLMLDAVANPKNYKDHPLVLQHVLYFYLEKVNKECVEIFERARESGKVPDLMNSEGHKKARVFIDKLKDFLSKKDIRKIIEKFHEDWKWSGSQSKFGDDLLLNLNP